MTISTNKISKLVEFGIKNGTISSNQEKEIKNLIRPFQEIHYKDLDDYGNERTIITKKRVDREQVSVDIFSSDLQQALINTQKHKINNLIAKNSALLKKIKDKDRFDAELRKEKKIRRVGFVIAFIIIPLLIITALCLFAPAVLPAIGHFLVMCLTVQGEGIIAGVFCAFSIITIPPILYYNLISGIRNALKFILGKDIFSEKHEIQKLDRELNNEQDLLNKLETYQNNHLAPIDNEILNKAPSNNRMSPSQRSNSTHFYSSNKDSNDNSPETTVRKDNISSIKL